MLHRLFIILLVTPFSITACGNEPRQATSPTTVIEAIEKLEEELAAAKSAKDSKKATELEEAIKTQKEWLAVLK